MASQVVGASACFQYQSFVRGHHVYQSSWTPARVKNLLLTPVTGEVLVVKKELGNEHDQYAVAVIRDGDVVGHVPQVISRVIFYFLGYDGNVGFCEVTGPRLNRAVGLGVEVPCLYKFYGRQSHVRRLERLLESKNADN